MGKITKPSQCPSKLNAGREDSCGLFAPHRSTCSSGICDAADAPVNLMAQGRHEKSNRRAWDSLTEFILLVEKHDISCAKCNNTGRYSNLTQQDDIHEEILRYLTGGLVTREDYIRVWNSKVRRSGVDRSYLLAEDWNAAAPDLLESLRRILTHMEPVAAAYYKRHEKTPGWNPEATGDLFESLLADAKLALAKAEGRDIGDLENITRTDWETVARHVLADFQSSTIHTHGPSFDEIRVAFDNHVAQFTKSPRGRNAA